MGSQQILSEMNFMSSIVASYDAEALCCYYVTLNVA